MPVGAVSPRAARRPAGALPPDPQDIFSKKKGRILVWQARTPERWQSVDNCHIPVTESYYPNRNMFRQFEHLPEAKHDI